MTFAIPRGFRFAGLACGIKEARSKEDLSLIVSDAPAVAAGVYTQNLVCAAPVVVDRARTPSDAIRVVVTNSGNANACTGSRGLADAEEMASLAARACGAKRDQALVMSTGVIGHFLPMDKIREGIPAAVSRLGQDEADFMAAARGILTTDKGTKTAARECSCQGRTVRIAGMAKGAGMIGPRMATMLAVVMTDARLTADVAQKLIQEAAEHSFHCISVEGHTSTNDTLLLLASGAAMAEPLEGESLRVFARELNEVCIELARQIPDDGEGATHLVTIEVRGCASRDAAFRIAKTVADSALIKTAVAGADPNWGRIVSAVGYAGVPLDPAAIQLAINGTTLYREGCPVPFDEARVSESMRSSRETTIQLDCGQGDGSVRFWTSDLTVDYVRFNSDYRT
jgi:glutamate N-acetyltransferase/amino-acid N-acetyltransferase